MQNSFADLACTLYAAQICTVSRGFDSGGVEKKQISKRRDLFFRINKGLIVSCCSIVADLKLNLYLEEPPQILLFQRWQYHLPKNGSANCSLTTTGQQI